jgi:2-isopropylmalate synthase
MAERLILSKGMQPLREEVTQEGLAVLRNRIVVPRAALDIHDTTLRDGWQKQNVNGGVENKIIIARNIDQITQPDVIEAGWPGANPVDTDLFKHFRDIEKLTHARLSSFGMTVAPYAYPEADEQLQKQVDAKAPVKTIVGKADIFQVEHGLKKPREENLRMIEETMAYLKADSDTEEVRFDAEHFFSGFRTDPAYALECLRAAARGGADMVVLCDTMGDAMQEDVELAMQTVLGDKTLQEEYAKHHDGKDEMPVGMHAHNDNGLAIGNSVTAIRFGARSVQGTITGIGERLGNANLQTLMLMRTRNYGTEDIAVENLPQMRPLAELVARNAGVELNADLEYVGDNAAYHKGGLHTSYVLENPALYEHDEPELFGNKRKIPVSAQNGRAGIKFNLDQLGLPFDVTKEFAGEITEAIKERGFHGYDYEQAHASFELLARRMHPDYKAPFTIVTSDSGETKQALIAVHKNIESTNGQLSPFPVTTNTESTFDMLKTHLVESFPQVAEVQFLTTRIRPHNGTTAVFFTVTDGVQTWTTTGVAPTEHKELATLEAARDAFEYAIFNSQAPTKDIKEQ